MTKEFDALWPYPIKGLVHISGPRGVGKTVLSIATGADPKHIAFFDGEQSAATYNAQLNFGIYHDLVGEFTARHSAFGSDRAYYEYVNAQMEKLPSSTFDVFVFDNVSRFESGMAGYVWAHPKEFDLTQGQLDKMPGLAWGKMKSLYEKWLLSISNKASLIIITTQLGEEWRGNRPSGAMKPKGKNTLEWLSVLQLWLRPNEGSPIPAAIVLKERLGKWGIKDGKPTLRRTLPRRLPIATWDAIRSYMQNPADFDHPAHGEVLSDEEWHMLRGTLTEEQRMQLRLAVLDAEAEAREQTGLVKGAKEEKASGIQNIGEFLAALTQRGLSPLDVQQKLGLASLGDLERHVFETLDFVCWDEMGDLDEALGRLGL